MKRAGYRDAVDFIAFNDEPTDLNPEYIVGYTTVLMVAELFGVPRDKVAADVLKLRKRAV